MPSNPTLLTTIKSLLDQARKQVVQTVNTTMVVNYFEIGKMIVEDEQNGENRAEYGKETLKTLSAELTKEYDKGFSVDNLENMRRFFLAYQNSETLSRKSQKGQALSDEFTKTKKLYSQLEKSSTLSRKSEIQQTLSAKSPNFNFSWSHYLILIINYRNIKPKIISQFTTSIQF